LEGLETLETKQGLISVSQKKLISV